MMNSRTILYFALILFLFSYPIFAQKQYKNEGTEIIILHTNDMHAKIDNMGKLAYLADSLRRIFPNVLLVSAGDNFTGNPVVDMVADKGFPMIDLMNACGFDLSAIGNHEFDMGQELLAKRIRQADFPFICANIDCSGSLMKQPPSYVILKTGNGIKIPFLGLLQLGDNGLPDTHPSKLEELKFTDGLLTAHDNSWLKEKYGNLIGLTHLGIETDKELAEELPRFDMIIGGHSHTLLDTAIIANDVMIVQAGWGLRYVGKITLTAQNSRITGRRYELISLDSIRKTDPKVQSMIDNYNNNPELKRVVGTAEVPITGFDELGSFITDALRTSLNTDFAFMNRRGIRIHALQQGEITIKDIYQMDPFQNEVNVVHMTLKEMETLIRYAYNLQERIDLAVSGMTYTIAVDSSGKFRSVMMKDYSGNPLDPGKIYSVAFNSYIAGSYRFEHKDPGYSTRIISEEILISYLEELKKINYSGIRRTFLEIVN